MSKRRMKNTAKAKEVEYPVATLVFYGPNDELATKAVVSIIKDSRSDPSDFQKWYCVDGDIREDFEIGEEIVEYIKSHGAKGTVGPDVILGCPHEEGKDYPAGESCPRCPYWAGRNRYTGKLEH